MKIEVLYIAGCPNHLEAVKIVREVVAQEGSKSAVDEVEVKDAATAQILRFLGSPSVRVNGVDVDPGTGNSSAYGVSCRTYTSHNGAQGTPPRESVRSAVRRALDES